MKKEDKQLLQTLECEIFNIYECLKIVERKIEEFKKIKANHQENKE